MGIHYELKAIFLIQVFPEDLKIAFYHQYVVHLRYLSYCSVYKNHLNFDFYQN